MKYVIDSSVAFKFGVVEVDTNKARQIRDDFAAGIHDLIAPDIFPVELAHAFTRAEQQRRILVSEARKLLIACLTHAPILHPSLPLLVQACDISSQLRVGIYDCLYLALAIQEHCDFLTADDKLLKQLQTSFPCTVGLPSLP